MLPRRQDALHGCVDVSPCGDQGSEVLLLVDEAHADQLLHLEPETHLRRLLPRTRRGKIGCHVLTPLLIHRGFNPSGSNSIKIHSPVCRTLMDSEQYTNSTIKYFSWGLMSSFCFKYKECAIRILHSAGLWRVILHKMEHDQTQMLEKKSL